MPPRSARPSGTKPRGKAAVSNQADTTEPNKGKNKVAKGKRPYPASRPLRDSDNLNKKGVFASTPDAPSGGGMALKYATLPVPPRISKISSSSSSAKSDRSYPDLGMPTREEFSTMQEQYIGSLDGRKQAKALISQEMFDDIWLALHKPRDNKIGSPQFRWWVRKMFRLALPDDFGGLTPYVIDPDDDTAGNEVMAFVQYKPEGEARGNATWETSGTPRALNLNRPLPVVLHDGKRVAIREQIYDIMCACHERVGHGGRDKTANEIRKTYTWVPKDLIALFVKNCPTCVCKRTRQIDDRVEDAAPPQQTNATPTDTLLSEDTTLTNPTLQYVSLPMNDLMGGPLTTFAASPGWSLAQSSSGAGLDTFMGAGASVADISSQWRLPPQSGLAPGSGYFYLPNGMYAASLPPQFDSLELPSIRVTDADVGGAQANPHQKVTLPSLSQVLSGELTAAGRGHARVRQPLQALSGNFHPGFQQSQFSSVPGYAYPSGPPSAVPYVPIIDPLLLRQDGVHMLALAADASQSGAN
ncbi:hypothetical protein BD310DRAFT_933059 [Dichomitus squalens]|uniref:Integrase zinc-binding domain-containing protein n=1 Tax=Dichomitus squalens TaxID=114155 RepID=A0A4Q9PNC9_9APHY|nr:hypothetical protein BD310DRAFT_933059 [Dichomitus squalens]